MKKIVFIVLALLLGGVGYGAYFLAAAMPIGTGYTAKYLCSQVFLAGRDPGHVFEQEVKPTNALFSLITHSVDRAGRSVTASGFGFLTPRTAVYRDGFGCTLVIDATKDELETQTRGAIARKKPDMNAPWPAGERVDLQAREPGVDMAQLERSVDDAFREPGPGTRRNTRAVVVVRRGRIIAEKYDPGFTSATPILGWSMTKSVTNALVGILVRMKKLDIMKPAPQAAWRGAGDPRGAITLDQLLRMSSGLKFVEIYGPLKDVTDMLYGSRSMADFAASMPLRTKPDGEWSYSSGTTNIVARIVRDRTGGTLASVYNFARTELFDRLNMTSAVIEPDASGSFVGSSYMFATPRDWARFGLCVLRDGTWNGARILPEGWMKYSTTPTPLAPKGEYGAHYWLNAGKKGNPKNRTYPTLPTELYYLSGFNGQMVAVVPSLDLVIVRMGVTHDDSWPQEKFIGRVLDSMAKK